MLFWYKSTKKIVLSNLNANYRLNHVKILNKLNYNHIVWLDSVKEYEIILLWMIDNVLEVKERFCENDWRIIYSIVIMLISLPQLIQVWVYQSFSLLSKNILLIFYCLSLNFYYFSSSNLYCVKHKFLSFNIDFNIILINFLNSVCVSWIVLLFLHYPEQYFLYLPSPSF